MYERFSDRARKIMQLAHQEAQRLNHGSIAPEHILLGLLRAGGGVGILALKSLGADQGEIQSRVQALLSPGAEAVSPGKLPMTPEAKKVIEQSIQEARSLSNNHVGSEHLLLALLSMQNTVAGHVLSTSGLILEQVRRVVVGIQQGEHPNDSTSVASPAAQSAALEVLDFLLLASRRLHVAGIGNLEAQHAALSLTVELVRKGGYFGLPNHGEQLRQWVGQVVAFGNEQQDKE